MFKQTEPVRRKKGFLPLTVLRLFLSLVIMAIFAVGVYQAFRYFSGLDPLEVNPNTLIGSLLASDSVGSTISRYLDVTLPGGRQPLKSLSSRFPIQDKVVSGDNQPDTKSQGELLYKFAVVADSHNDNTDLDKALSQAKVAGAKFIIGLGDWSQVGTVKELEEAKAVFDASSLPYYVTAGDHDLWDSRNKDWLPLADFNQVFGPAYQTFSDGNIRYIIIDNSDSNGGLGVEQTDWLKATLQSIQSKPPAATFLFMHMPLYHPTSDHVMGNGSSDRAAEAKQLINLAKEAGVKTVFAGHVHAFTSYTEPRSGLKMVTAGAITAERNTQNPHFLMVDVYSSGDYNIEDTEIK